MTESKTSKRRIVANERSARAVEMRLSGATYAQIAAELGISQGGAYKAVTRAMDLARERMAESAETLREIERERLEHLIAAALPKAQAGDTKAIEAARRLSESLRRVLGLDAPARTDITSGGERIAVIGVGVDTDKV